MRILPEEVEQQHPAEDKGSRILHIVNHAPGAQSDFLARNIIDGGCLLLVRYGIGAPDDPIILATVKVIDAILMTDTPAGPAWHRYNHDGYGQDDGGPFTQHGVGRVWPLLTGERGHYELAAGNSTETCLRAMEGLASNTGLLPEQSWDQADRPEIYMWLGQPTGSAMPLMWAHAEYVKLLRSTVDGKVYDCIPEVAKRYLGKRGKRKQLEVWKPNRHVRFMRTGEVLRVHGEAAFTQQSHRLSAVVDQSCGDEEVDGQTPLIGQQVDLRRQTSSGAPQSLVFAPFLRSVAACLWTRTIVESIIKY
jgi:glucoamylase